MGNSYLDVIVKRSEKTMKTKLYFLPFSTGIYLVQTFICIPKITIVILFICLEFSFSYHHHVLMSSQGFIHTRLYPETMHSQAFHTGVTLYSANKIFV